MMQQSRKSFNWVILIVGAIFLLIAAPAFAQDDAPVELIGLVEAMGTNTITVNQQVIDISRAEVNTAIMLASVVEVEGVFTANGRIQAREVNAVRPGVQPGEAELTGIVQSLNGSLLVMNGQTIDLTGAEVYGTPEVGQIVRLHVIATAPGQWRAREIEAGLMDDDSNSNDDDYIEITGPLTSMDGSTVSVAGQTIDISSARIRGVLVVGAQVEVEMTLVDGVLTAREIKLANPDDDDNDNGNDNSSSDDNGNDNRDDDNSNDNSDDSLTAAVSVEQAIASSLAVYPNSRVRSLELTTRFGGTVVWEVELNNGIELIIDAQNGAILVIDRPGSDDDGSDDNGNDNSSDDNGNDNSSDDNGNDNDDDDDNSNNSGSSNSNDDDGGDNDDD